MTACVVDASVVVKWFFPEEHSLQCLELLSTVDELLAPDLVWAETGNVVWKRLTRGEISADETLEIVADILRMPIIEIASHDLLLTATEIATKVGITVYDALYLALALSRDCTMITADQKLVNKLTGSPFESVVRHISQIDGHANSND